jgi:hypothetical protein
VIEQLLRHAGVFKMEGFGGHGDASERYGAWLGRILVKVVPLVRTTVLALGLPTPSVGNTIQSEHETESITSLVGWQCSNAIQSELRLFRCPNHHARRERWLQPSECDCGINLLAMRVCLMTHQRDGPQPSRLLYLWQQLEPVNRFSEWQVALGNSIEHLRVRRKCLRKRRGAHAT